MTPPPPLPVVVLRTHVLDAHTDALLAHLSHDLGHDRVFVLFDDSRGGWSKRGPHGAGMHAMRLRSTGTGAHKGFAADVVQDGGGDVVHRRCVLLVDDAQCLAQNPMHDKCYGHDAASWQFWHPETGIVAAHEWLRAIGALGPADHVWFIEYDVRCHGSFAKALARCNEHAGDADFVAMGGGEGQLDMRLQATDPGWCWWPRLTGDIDASAPAPHRVGAFFPLVRVSGRLANLLRSHFGRSTGFCEVYIPTLCAREPGFRCSGMPADAVGSFRYRPIVSHAEWAARVTELPPDDRLYHPIK